MHTRFLAAFTCALLSLGATTAQAQAREEGKLLVAAQVLDELREQSDQQIPQQLLQRAYGVAVIPDVTKAAFFLGGRHGTGVLSVRDSQGRFSNPLFIDFTGGSIGWQIGIQETDIVLVFVTKRGIEGIEHGTLTLGAGVSVAAGPLGRQGEAAVSTKAEIYAYSRARGLFAGAALDGTVITISDSATGRFYGMPAAPAADIISGAVTNNSDSVRRFLAALTAHTGDAPASHTHGAAAGTTPAATPGPAPVDSTTAPAQTFSLEDPK
ncbi:MAG: lipid-binding SYLF domain-containing protein [Pseudomonadota bacterium]